jgi:hypothetical protein
MFIYLFICNLFYEAIAVTGGTEKTHENLRIAGLQAEI